MPYNKQDFGGEIMESRYRIKPKLSFSPSKHKENVYRVTARNRGNLPQIQIRETLVEASRGNSLSPRKNRQGSAGLFRNAHQIDSAETFLPEKLLSHTNASSSPPGSQGSDHRLEQPVLLAKGGRSMSSSQLRLGRDGKMIQRTVSIVIEGRSAEGQHEELMDTLSRIILGEERREDFLIELQESSIHGEEENFFELDSDFLGDIIASEQPQF